MGTQERKERERAARLQSIRQAALEVFAERGYAQATMDEVAEKAELAKGTVYYYFSSKAALFEDVLQHYTALFFQRLLEQLNPQDDLLTAIEKILRGYVAFFRELPHFFRLHLTWESSEAREAGLDLSHFRERYRELRRPLEEALISRVPPEKRKTVDPEVLLYVIGGLVLLLSAQLGHGRAPEEVDDLVTRTVQFLSRAINAE